MITTRAHRWPRALRAASTAILAAAAAAAAAGAAEVPAPALMIPAPFPVGEQLSYAVSWMGIHCGKMDILSFAEPRAEGAPTYRIVVFARTTKFFDGVHKVRTRLDSFFDPAAMTSVRYEEHSLEKKRHKVEIWTFDAESRTVSRTKNGEASTIEVEAERAYDPLAFIFRLRETAGEVGDSSVLELMTSKGAVETVARTTEAREVRTKRGRCDAVAVVPEPQDRMLFSKSGAMVVWVETDPPHRPCRIEFDLSFGKLVANLAGVEALEGPGLPPEWTWWETSLEGE